MLKTAGQYLSLVRFSHTLFALPFALLAAAMAWRWNAMQGIPNTAVLTGDGPTTISLAAPPGVASIALNNSPGSSVFAVRWQELLGILLCMVTARSASMAFNRLVDRQIDVNNPRTSGRHLPAGSLSVGQVRLFTALCATAFVASTLLFLPNRLPLYLSVPVLAFLGGYSYAKRFTSLTHVWLGAALALAPVAVWIAIRGELLRSHPADLLPALILGGTVLAWVTGFDIIYACQDYDHDSALGLHSIPAHWGVAAALRLAAGCHGLSVLMLALLPAVYPQFGTLYWLAVVGVTVLLIYEHALVRPDDLQRVNIAFFHVNAVISLGLFAVGTLDLWLGSG